MRRTTTRVDDGLCRRRTTTTRGHGGGDDAPQVLSQARNAGVVVWGVMMYSETLGPIQLVGYLLSLVAFSYYR